MGRRIERLTLDHLDALPGRCSECVFWELDPVRRAAVHGHAAEEKAAWVSRVLREWGSCGRVAIVDGQVVGHLIWAPPVHVPGADGFATAPISTDAVVLTTANVDPLHRGGGLGRMLVQGMAKDLVLRGDDIRAVEAFGDSRGRSGHCVVPTDFLLAVGFSTQRAHPVNPRMRMDLRTTLTIREELEKGLEALLGAVAGHRARSPVPGPVPQRVSQRVPQRVSQRASHRVAQPVPRGSAGPPSERPVGSPVGSPVDRMPQGPRKLSRISLT